MFTERAIGRILAAGFILITIVGSVGGGVDCPDCPDPDREAEYMDGQILVKFSRAVSDVIREHLGARGTVDTLRLSGSLDRLTGGYSRESYILLPAR